jgi:hypothetical protein
MINRHAKRWRYTIALPHNSAIVAIIQVDHWGSHGMAVHPLRLINVVGALDFAKPSHNQYLQVSASIF